jgi:hypothetical protein
VKLIKLCDYYIKIHVLGLKLAMYLVVLTSQLLKVGGIVYNMPQNDQQCVPMSNSNMQMPFNNIQTINDRLQKF